ncbi:MAG: hypothetical protein ACKO96_41440 [Flammeovirgaceae bacterium]
MKTMNLEKMEKIEGGGNGNTDYCRNMSASLSGAYARGDWNTAIAISYWAGKMNCGWY